MIASDKLTDGRLIDLPAAAGDPASPRFEPHDDWLRDAPAPQQKAAMWRWFATHYDDPADSVPHDEAGNYLYTDGGPYDAGHVLRGRFGSIVGADVLGDFIAAVETEGGSQWALKALDKAGG